LSELRKAGNTLKNLTLPMGKTFKLEEIDAAMQFSSDCGGKAVFCPFI